MVKSSSPGGRLVKAIGALKVMVVVLVLAACGSAGGDRQVKLPVSKVEEPGLELSAYFFAAPDEFGFVADQKEPGVSGIYSQEVGERLVKELAERRGFKLTGDAPARSTELKGKLKEVREFVYPTEYEMPVFDRKVAKADILVKDGDFIAVGGFLPEMKLKAANFTAQKGAGGGGGHNFVALIQVETGE